MWSISDLFPSWGDTGTKPADGTDRDGGDQISDEEYDYLWYAVNELENEVRDALTDLDSDQDGAVDEADAGVDGFDFLGSAILGGDVTDGSGNTLWNDTAKYVPVSSLQQGSGSGLNADSVDGVEPPFASSVSDDGTQILAVPTDINFADNIAVTDDGDGTVRVSSDDNASTVDGPDGTSHVAGSLPEFPDTSTGLSNTSEGDLFYNTSDNSVYLNEGP
jgi:hypothetical protein